MNHDIYDSIATQHIVTCTNCDIAIPANQWNARHEELTTTTGNHALHMRISCPECGDIIDQGVLPIEKGPPR